MEKLKKNILIIGGGISGLALLHYLKIKHYYRDDITIQLLEKNSSLGGTIHTIQEGNIVFERGPNGFLDSKPRSLKLINELDLDKALIKSRDESKSRFVSIDHALHAVPTNPKSFFKTPLLTPFEKMRVLSEVLIPKKLDEQESVYNFGKRRLGKKFTQTFIDAMVSGIYGGDAQQLNLKYAFPRMFELEQNYGSLFKAMVKYQRQGRSQVDGSPKGTLRSFSSGMSEIIKKLGERHKENIAVDVDIQTISRKNEQYAVYTKDLQYTADAVYLCTPAYGASRIVKNMDSSLAEELNKIYYAPIAVVGLVYSKETVHNIPEGYGYLIPSSENSKVLGVLFESSIFDHRCPKEDLLLRVMIGGSRHPEILQNQKEEIIQLAMEELKNTLKINEKPKKTAYMCWEKAIPQYDQNYPQICNRIFDHLASMKNLHIVANYVKGISFNDCVENAYQAAFSSKL